MSKHQKPKIQKSLERQEKARKILNKFSNAIENVCFDDSFSKTVDILINLAKKNCGKVVCTGMGKAGIIMHKFSATLSSLGISSVFMHPGEALHGDLGIVQPNDVLFVASTSGKTREVLDIIYLSKKRNVKNIIGITSHIDSPIRNIVDIVIDMGSVEEAGLLKLTPTTSTIVMLSILDALALVVSDEIGFTAEDYSVLHHSGYLGEVLKQITNTIKN